MVDKKETKAVEEKAKPVEKKADEKKSESIVDKAKKVVKKEDKKEEKKPELVREYVVPMRKGFLKAPEYRKSKKAVKTLKEFIAKHMKVEDRDISKVKVDIYLNNEIWHRGIRKPLNKVKVIAEKKDGIVYVRLADVPEAVKFKMAKDAKRFKKVDQKAMKEVKKKEAAEEEIKEGREDNQDKTEEKEKEKASAETKEISQERAAKAMSKTTSAKPKKVESGVTQRKALKK
jgi:large subunit ribosomal protein L31e